jgi:hypothetical protein
MKVRHLIFLVLVVGALAWYLSSGKTEDGFIATPVPPPIGNQQQEQNNIPEIEETITDVPNALEGELQVSNDTKRGNLMLLLKDSDKVIYLNTSRDFSSLTGKQVIVTIDGSQDDFRLVDIKAK